MLSFIKKHAVGIVICLFSFLLLSYFGYYNEFHEGDADNYWHYYFSRYSFQYPEFFLNHWGKPLFILLSSGFSQFGFFGLQLFNITCGILAAIVSYKFAIALKLRFNWLVLLVLLFTPIYFQVLPTGLTEPLMSLLLITVFYFLYVEKFLLAAIIMSFSIYARSEGMFLTIYVLMYLSLIRKWKYIPCLFVGFIIYSFVGLFSGHDFLWYFTENPYGVKSVYGHGEWSSFFLRSKYIWGVPQLIFVLLGLFIILFSTFKNVKKIFKLPLHQSHKLLLLIVAPAIIFFLFHVIAWKFGLFASIGLDRVLVSVSPFFALICWYGINKLLGVGMLRNFSWLLIVVFIYFIVVTPFKLKHYPTKAYGSIKVELEMSKWFSTLDQNCRVYYAHPAIIFNTNRNPFNKALNIEQFALNPDDLTAIEIPTYIFWDSQFSEFNCGVKLETLENSDRLNKIKEMEETGFKLVVFEVKK